MSSPPAAPIGVALLGERERALGLVGVAPHGDSSCAPARHASVSPCSSAPHSAFLVARIAAGEFLAIFSASSCAASRSRSGGSTTCEIIPSCARPRRGHALVAPDQRHAHDRLERHLVRQPDALVRHRLPDRHVRVEERGVARGDHDVGVGDEVEPTAGAGAVDRRDHRLPHLVVPRGEARARRRACGATARVIASLSRLSAATSRPVWKLRPFPVFTITRTAGSSSSSRHASSSSAIIARVHRVADVGPVEDQPADGPLPLDDEAFVHLSARRSRAAASRRTRRALRGSLRCATTAPSRTPRCGDARRAVRWRPRAAATWPGRAPTVALCASVATSSATVASTLGGGDGAVDHPPFGGLGAVDDPAEQHHLAGAHVADAARQQPGGAAVGREPAVDERRPEPRRRRRRR